MRSPVSISSGRPRCSTTPSTHERTNDPGLWLLQATVQQASTFAGLTEQPSCSALARTSPPKNRGSLARRKPLFSHLGATGVAVQVPRDTTFAGKDRNDAGPAPSRQDVLRTHAPKVPEEMQSVSSSKQLR